MIKYFAVSITFFNDPFRIHCPVLSQLSFKMTFENDSSKGSLQKYEYGCSCNYNLKLSIVSNPSSFIQVLKL